MLRDAVKRLLPRVARTGPGKHVVHAATAGDRNAERFGTVTRWPERLGGFEDLDFLFTSSQLNHGVASLRFDEAALLFRLVRDLGAGARIVELGRYKGGSTFVMAAALGAGGSIVSYDLHEAHDRGMTGDQLDRELREALDRYALGGVELVVGDTRAVPLPEGTVDLLFVDADHRYEGARADVERWSPLLRAGGHLLLHDAADTGGWGTTYPGLQRLAGELDRDPRLERQRGAGTIVHYVRAESSAA
jgi:predicted O-methyltransferase YrrM